MMPSFPKIYHVGSPEIKDTLLIGSVEITEKIDGSQIGFGRDEQGRLMIRSKGAPIYQDECYVRQPDKLFKAACEHILAIQSKIDNGVHYYGEVISSPKHNTLEYSRTPKNFIMLYGMMVNRKAVDDFDILSKAAEHLDLETVPLIFEGNIQNVTELTQMLEMDSTLGKTKIEGVVVKNYNQVADSKLSPYCFGKYVSEKFKEMNSGNWAGMKKANSVDAFVESLRTEARWEKTIQHLRDDGKLVGAPKDIGPLIEECIKDCLTENEQLIKDKLFGLYRRAISGSVVKGLPEYYKKKLMEQSLCQNAAVLPTNSASTADTNILEPQIALLS